MSDPTNPYDGIHHRPLLPNRAGDVEREHQRRLRYAWAEGYDASCEQLRIARDDLSRCSEQNARLLSSLSTIAGRLIVDADDAAALAAEVRELARLPELLRELDERLHAARDKLDALAQQRALGDPEATRLMGKREGIGVALDYLRPLLPLTAPKADPSECPANHGAQCCGYPAMCRAALTPRLTVGERRAFSNGTEFDAWQHLWCSSCAHDHEMHQPDGSGGCDVIVRALTDRPTPEWVLPPAGEPSSLPSRMRCTLFEPCPVCGDGGAAAVELRAKATSS